MVAAEAAATSTGARVGSGCAGGCTPREGVIPIVNDSDRFSFVVGVVVGGSVVAAVTGTSSWPTETRVCFPGSFLSRLKESDLRMSFMALMDDC